MLDTHALIFFLEGSKSLPHHIHHLIENEECGVSMANLWEIVIKTSLGKLGLKSEFSKLQELLMINSISPLAISFSDLIELQNLAFIHRDPFDRLLIAQSINRDLTLITKDQFIHQYPVKTLW